MFIQANGVTQTGQVTSRPDGPSGRQLQHDVRRMPFRLPELTTATFPPHMKPFEAVDHLLKESRNPSERLFMLHSGDGAKEAIFEIANNVLQRPQWAGVTQIQVLKKDAPGAGVIRDLYEALKGGPLTIGSNRPALLPVLGPMLEQRAHAENAFKNGKLLNAGMLMVAPAGMEKLSKAQHKLLTEHADTLVAELASRERDTKAGASPRASGEDLRASGEASSPRGSREDLRTGEEDGVYANFPLRQDTKSASSPRASREDLSAQEEDNLYVNMPPLPVVPHELQKASPKAVPLWHADDPRQGIDLGPELQSFGKVCVADYAYSYQAGIFNRKPKGSSGAAAATNDLVNRLNTHTEKLKAWILTLRERAFDITGAQFDEGLITSLHQSVSTIARQVPVRGALTRHVNNVAFRKAFEEAEAAQKTATAEAMQDAPPDQRREAWANAIVAQAKFAIFQGLMDGGRK